LTDPPGPRGGQPVLPPVDGAADREGPGWRVTLEAAGEPARIVAADPDGVALAAADLLVDRVEMAIAIRGRADVALTGGSTPRAMYRRLLEPRLRDRVHWELVHLWWGDDRYVRRVDPLSNLSLADEALLAPDGLPIPPDNVHPFQVDAAISGGRGPGWCAANYATEVVAALPAVDGWPSFDLALVGIGGDGHLLSVFPGSAALRSDRVGLAIPAPTHIEPQVERVTLNPAILGAASHVLAMAGGAAKAEVVARILDGPRDPDVYPGTLARRAGATWILDAAAAAGLADDGARTGSASAGTDGAGAVAFRRATPDDAAEIGDIWLASFAASYEFPHSHTEAEVRAWLRDEIVAGEETWVAVERPGRLAGFMALEDDMLDQLYLRPERTGHGIGSRLMTLAKARRPTGFDLYTFQANAGARRFYVRHGFTVVDVDEGGRNEEHQPDVRYRWRPTAAR
jgi:6-phosphogluconolactonase